MSSTFLLRMAAAAAAAVTVLPALPAYGDGPGGHGAPADRAAPPTRGLELACPADRVTGGDYSDIAASAHGASIRCLSWYGVTKGGADGTFGADRAVTRAQLATFLLRVLTEAGVEVPAAAPDAFSDDEGNPHEASLDALAALDIVNGSGDGRVNPDAAVRRDQMASFLIAALEQIEQQELADAVADYFADDDSNVHRGAINALAGLGIAAGRAQGIFDPSSEVKRDQLATFLMRLIDRLVEQGDVRVPASLVLSAEEVAAGDVVEAAVLGDGIVSVSLAGCGFDGPVTDADPATDGVQFALTVPTAWPGGAGEGEEPAEEPAEEPVDAPVEEPVEEVAPADETDAEEECEFVATVTFADGSTEELEGELEFADAEESEGSEGEEPEGAEGSEDSDEDADGGPEAGAPVEAVPAPADGTPTG